MRHAISRAALILAIVLAALMAEPSPGLSQGKRSDLVRERLKSRPNDPTLYYYLALFEATEGDTSGSRSD